MTSIVHAARSPIGIAMVVLGLAVSWIHALRAAYALGTLQEAADGWQIASPEAEGLKAVVLADIAKSARRDPRQDLRSILIVRNGRLVFEIYLNGHRRESLHDVRSVTKSITSALVGIAIAERILPGTDAPVIPLLAEGAQLSYDGEWKARVTLGHLLTMTSGLHANDDDPATPGHEDRLAASTDWLRYALNLPMAREPGRRWVYSSVNTFLLGAAVEQASGMRLSEFARERLFGPLGVRTFQWQSTREGRTVAQGNLAIRARDMARFGQLYLDHGTLGSVQVIPQAWVEASVRRLYPVPWDGYGAYGYGWYVDMLTVAGREFRYFFASGNGGNKIYVLPDARMVVAIQSAAYNRPYAQQRSLELLQRILSAVAV